MTGGTVWAPGVATLVRHGVGSAKRTHCGGAGTPGWRLHRV